MTTAILLRTALVEGRLAWAPEEAEAFELLTGQPAPATVQQALAVLRALPPQPRTGSTAADVLAEADAAACAALIRDLETLAAAR